MRGSKVVGRGSWVAALLLIAACGAQQPSPPPTTPPAPPAQPTGPRVTFPDGTVIRVEIASDDATRAQGLMYRDSLPPNTGMLFLFAQTGEYPFWMKNTLIPLDMVWIDEAQRVAHVKYDVPPCKADPCPSYPPNAPARFILEVPAGVARQHGIVAGSQLKIEGTEGYVIR